MYKRLFNPPNKSFFLFGPRGTGKTTWIKKHFSKAIIIDLLDPSIFRQYSTRPESIKNLVYAHPAQTIFVIDEVQKVPDLLGMVHKLIEENKSWIFILTGSSARKLKKTGVDLLAGRALLKTMHPFMAWELGKDFVLNKALNYGMLPVIVDDKNPEATLKTYIALYIREEVQMEGIVRNIHNFNRFLEAVSFSHASVLNITNIARECEVDRRVVQDYILVLEDLLIAFRLSIFTRRAKRQTIRHEKLYLFDAGVYRTLRPAGPLDRYEEIEGSCLEGLVAQHLRAWNAYGQETNKLYYWRTRNGLEVDFVIYGPEEFIAIEVKNNKKVRPQDLRGLKSFSKDYPEAKRALLYRGKERLVIDEIVCLPVEEFLRTIYPGKKLL